MPIAKKRVIVSVINDLATDQRVQKTCHTIAGLGFDILLVGRKLPNSLPLKEQNYRQHRMNLMFKKGPLFYFEFTVRLFFFMLFKRADIYFSNDLDTLLPNYLCSKIKNVKLVYDTHEYFTEVPELQNNLTKKKIWKTIENWIFPKLKYIFTVNCSIAKLYKDEYGVEVKVIRNIPLKKHITLKTRKELGLPESKKIIIMQGSGINIHRGAEEAVQSMQFVNNAVLLIIGGGDVISELKRIVNDLKISDKVIFMNKVPYETLMQYTMCSDVGLTLDKDTNLNYRYSLPNKLFDYIYAGIAVLGTPLVEVKNIFETYNVGMLTKDYTAEEIGRCLNLMLSNEEKLNEWKMNSVLASSKLTWENEKNELVNLFQKLG